MGFPCGSAGKESACNVGNLGSISRLGRCPGEGKGYLLQYSGLENSMNCIVLGVEKSQAQLKGLLYLSLILDFCMGDKGDADTERFLGTLRAWKAAFWAPRFLS